MISLTCQCCQHTQEFVDSDAAFQQGWDAPPHFTGYVACDLCPGSFVVMGRTAEHSLTHEKWKRGRPAEFQIP